MPDSTVAWMFPGQGSQERGMGRDLYESDASARELFDHADALLGRPLSRLCFEGPDEELNQTANAQPAIYVMSLACLAAARHAGLLRDAPAFVTGHSLGEYTALVAAGALTFEDGLRLVEERGRLTQAAAAAAPGGMAALLGIDEAAASAICAEAGAELCNINSPGQLVIGGTMDAVARARAIAIERGARKAVPLDVSGAFHTSLMQAAVSGMREVIDATEVRTPSVPFVANDRAAVVAEPADIRDELIFQLTHPVRWVQCVEYVAARGVRTFIEIGPGRVLGGLVKRIVREATVRNINGVASLTA